MSLPDLKNVPPAVKAGATLAAGGGIMAALAVMFPPTVLAIIAAGVAVVGLLFVGYKALLKVLEKRKAAPMERALSGNSSAAPTSINNPARRARLDDMRRSFETGVEKFRDAGKNIYSLPWYVLVGEPGSGKTEAIRHCNVGFPPGLQDQLQGVGGTINMNWWFTNYAVILDTAGRLMFEEVEPGTTSEWQEFLKLLRKVRPNCPVNGLLLVIPAESLIRDTADAIERKGGKIAQQLDGIQRALGVRFPVYVVVTKCDLINGFREFFDDVSDPQLQHQMLGWSNPSNLDEPFNPELVEQHLRTVQQRLVRRRLGLLKDPIHSEDPSRKRTEQVDALYAFPDALVKIAPRLRRYLEMIFVAGEWSQKPLFLRGIYFTSSMREGAALDADLAEALGMPVESLPEGRVWERERAYFLRDLFMNKVFREKGLVTRASNTSAQMRKRRTMLFGTAAVGALLVALLTVLGWRGLSKQVAEPSEFWAKTREVYVEKGATQNWVSGSRDYLYPIARPESRGKAVFYYDGTAPGPKKEIESIPLSDEKRASIGDFPVELLEQARREIGIPWVYKPVAAVTGFNVTNLEAGRRAEAAASIFERSVVEPLVDYARARLESEVGDDAESAWTPTATGAVRELIGLEAAAVARREGTPPIQLTPVTSYVLYQAAMEKPDASGIDFEAYKAAQADAARQLKGLQEVADWLYDPKRGAQPWPPAQVRTGDVKLLTRAFERYKGSIGKDQSEGSFSKVEDLMAALKEFEDAEKALLQVTVQPDVAKAWDERYAKLRETEARVSSLLSVVESRALKAAFNTEFEKYQKTVEKAHDALLERFEPVIALDGTPDEKLAKSEKDRVEELQALHDEIRRSRAKLSVRSPERDAQAKECERLDMVMLKAAGRTEHAFRQRLAMYDTADKVRATPDGELTIELGALRDRLATIDRSIGDARAKIDERRKAGTSGMPEAKPADDLIQSAADVSGKYASDVAGGQRRAALLTKWMDDLSPEGKPLDGRAAALSKDKAWRVARPLIPLTRAAVEKKDAFDPSFDARAAAAILSDCAQIEAAAKPGGAPVAKEVADRAERLRKEAETYGEKYLGYWSRGLLADLEIPEQSWAEFAAGIKTLGANSINSPLGETAEIVLGALRDVGGLAKGNIDAGALRQQAEASRASLQANQSIASGRTFSNWRSLGEDSVVAANSLRGLALRDLPGFQEQYIICYPGRTSGQPLGNFVEKYWEDFCYVGTSAIAKRAQADGNAAFVRVRDSMKFPVVLSAAGATEELTLEQVATLRRDVEQASAIGGRKQEGAARGALACDRFTGVVNQLQGAGALQPIEQEWLDKLREVAAGLPDGAPLSCKITVVGDRPLGDGQEPISKPFLEMAMTAGGAAPAKGEYLRVMNVNLGQFKYPDASGLAMHFYKAGGAGKPDETMTIGGTWGVLRLIGKYPSELSPDRKACFVKISVPLNNENYYAWLKLEMDKELPDLKRWRELKPAP